ncbi:putative HNH endonuclease [Sinorhizobium phage phiM7]|uniref:Putative HNH nuclease domain-containing protein n=2 Tax=Emdodecavirus TaxID=1980937 RepID=S5M709_9CAUD|nr:HNH endonuclease [Sinorhizobium phage phiM12]YP_009601276.1 HNH endonuclease [Sinorhizobium phage phiM7]AGR47851.1 putative HNH nuclease domain-containing protein [Sinorhizobium phage phiM12]AKF12697.1 putative HNH endonuclease [Sinorhizobium phage phiM7]AKF13056.1 putative HNH endonuclease [Sinorhizobium phage phiM19]
MVQAMGGKCQICSYDKSNNVLEFHHLDPSQKDFSFGKARASPVSWSTTVNELKKCILLCSNCHREVHAGVTSIPETYAAFDPEYEDYRKLKAAKPTKVREPKPPLFDWSRLQELVEAGHSNIQIGKILGCSETAVRKQRKKWLGR